MGARSVAHRSRKLWIALLILVAIGLKIYDAAQPDHVPTSFDSPPTQAESPKSRKASNPASATEKIGGYESYRGCTLVEARSNDGDSFMVQLPGGKRALIRLYFVDAPESAFRSYPGGDTNHERIRQQAAEMGGITPEQAVEIGKQARQLTLGLLGGRPFHIYTRWDSPFRDNRYHAHVEVREDGKSRWLDELLIERGLARIKTKPAALPDGTPASAHLARLKDLERAAKRAEAGVWGFK
jgi:endonuclease YncB( thermonuclease family)